MEGKTALGASSPAKPALTRPEPLSHTSAVCSSSSESDMIYDSEIVMNVIFKNIIVLLLTTCGAG